MTRAKIIGCNIRKLRKSLGMTQVEFASEIGRSQSVVAQYETGQRMPSTEIIGEIASKYGITFDAIYNSTEENQRHAEQEDWYGEYFGLGDEVETKSIELTMQEIYLIKCYREAEPTAQSYALQMLESNPAQKEKSRA